MADGGGRVDGSGAAGGTPADGGTAAGAPGAAGNTPADDGAAAGAPGAAGNTPADGGTAAGAPGAVGGVAADDDAAGAGSDGARVHLAEAGRLDADEVIALWHNAGLTRPWNDPEADFEQARTGPTSAVLIARAGGQPLVEDPEVVPDDGDIVATAMVGVDGHRGWIYYFATHPRAQGAGHGAHMLAACEEWLAAHGARKVHLMVRQDNPAASFYTDRGYSDQSVTVLGRWLSTS